jgi:hypothetical protein
MISATKPVPRGCNWEKFGFQLNGEEPVVKGCNWANLFQGNISAGTWPSRLVESGVSDSKMWL